MLSGEEDRRRGILMCGYNNDTFAGIYANIRMMRDHFGVFLPFEVCYRRSEIDIVTTQNPLLRTLLRMPAVTFLEIDQYDSRLTSKSRQKRAQEQEPSFSLRARAGGAISVPGQSSGFRYASKKLALIHSSFDEVLFLDSDMVLFTPPGVLFNSPQYQRSGTLFVFDIFLGGNNKWPYSFGTC